MLFIILFLDLSHEAGSKSDITSCTGIIELDIPLVVFILSDSIMMPILLLHTYMTNNFFYLNIFMPKTSKSNDK